MNWTTRVCPIIPRGNRDEMEFATFRRGQLDRPVVATAVHNGHELRPEVAGLMRLESETRLREEDPHTDFFAAAFDTSVVVHRSRFEVDLNRPRATAVYAEPADSWDLELWKEPLRAEVKEESLRLYDAFYSDLRSLLDALVTAQGGFVLYDLHSYNHRRGGPESPAEPPADNPVLNLGTGSLPIRWRAVANAFVEAMSDLQIGNEYLDIRENVKFRGRQVAAWVHENYGGVGCALAIELKKVWMDEWTGTVEADLQQELREALLTSVAPVTVAWSESAGH